MGDDISPGLSSMAVCFDFRSTVVQLSNQNPYFCQFRCHHPLITQINMGDICKICEKMTDSSQLILSLTIISFQWFAEHAWLSRFTIFLPEYDLRHLKKKSYPDIIGFTIFSTYTQKINQGLLQNWWVKTLFERVIKFMHNSWRLTKYNFISKYLVKTEQV